MPNKNSQALNDFVRYCKAHPDERFWQALRNWSRFQFIIGRSLLGPFSLSYFDVDTFNFEGLQGKREKE
jgi:hypothetical protein